MLRRPLGVWFLALAVTALVADGALAQQPGGGRPGGFRGGPGGGFGGGGFGGPGGGSNEMGLLASEQVQKELGLLPEQVEDLTKLRESSRPDFSLFQGLRELPEEERNKKMEEIRAKMQETQKANLEKVNGILLPHQAERLKGISIQVRGAAVLEDPTIAEELKISDDQKAKITSTREAQREKVTAMFQQGGGERGGQDEAAREAMRAKFTKLRQENDAELMAILSSEQREQLEKMKGDKFELDMSQMNRGGPGGPGGPSRFGGGNRRPGEGGDRRPGGDGGSRRPGGEGNRPSNRPTNDEPKET